MPSPPPYSDLTDPDMPPVFRLSRSDRQRLAMISVSHLDDVQADLYDVGAKLHPYTTVMLVDSVATALVHALLDIADAIRGERHEVGAARYREQ